VLTSSYLIHGRQSFMSLNPATKNRLDEIGAILNTVQSSQDLSECFNLRNTVLARKG
jgi:hypothetical protein